MSTSFSPRGDAIAVAFNDEVTFGVAPGGNWTQTLIYSHTMEEKQPYVDDSVLGQPRVNNRDPLSPAPGLPVLAGDFDVPLDLAHFGYWLKWAMGAPSTSGSGSNFTHIFSSGSDVLPQRSLEVQQNTALFYQYVGLACDKLGFNLGHAAGYDHVVCSLIGRKENLLTSTGAGTPPTILTRAPVVKAVPVLKLAGTVVGSILTVKADFANGLLPQNFIGDPYPVGQDLDGIPSFTGTVTARFRDSTIYSLAKAQAPITLELLWSNNANRSLSVLTNAAYLEPFGVPVKGPGGIDVSFNFRAAQNASSPMLTVTLKSPTATF
jgi:hypothetical protein